jgi:hypothetical protein
MSVCAIVLSYKRPQNIERIVAQLAEVSDISRILVSNNNPEVELGQWFDFAAYPVEVINQPVKSLCAKRFELALQESFDYFICPDDDLFLTPPQIDALISAIRREPERVHGVFGEIHSFKDARLCLGGGIHGVECEVDILNRCYVFTKKHVERMNELALALDYKDLGQALYVDDVLLSFSGSGLPVCHDVGPLDECPSSDQPGIATYLEQGFDDIRIDTYLRLARTVAGDPRRR